MTGGTRPEAAVNMVDQQEAGVKWRTDAISIEGTCFYAKTANTNLKSFNPPATVTQHYEAYGAEFDLSWRLMEHFQINGGVTFTHSEITSDNSTTADIGKTPERIAPYSFQVSPTVVFDKFSAGLMFEGNGPSWGDDLNTLRQPSYVITNGFAEYSFMKGLTLSLHVNNLFDELAITELEFGALSAGQRNLVEGRTLPGRTINLSLTYRM